MDGKDASSMSLQSLLDDDELICSSQVPNEGFDEFSPDEDDVLVTSCIEAEIKWEKSSKEIKSKPQDIEVLMKSLSDELLPFSVQMETNEGHVPPTSEFITPRISEKEENLEQFLTNGLTGIKKLDVDIQGDQHINVIVYCEQAKSSAEKLRDEIRQRGHSASLLRLTEAKDLKEKIQLEPVQGLYMMADSSLFELLFQKRHHRGFHSVVNDFMDELEDSNKCISLFNRMEEGDDRFMKLLNQFPTNCAREVERASISIDSGIADLSLNENSKQESGGAAAESGNNLKDGPSSNQRVTSDSIKTGPSGDAREIHYSQKDACLMSSPPEGLTASPGSAEFNSAESREGEAEVKSEREGELELTKEESLSEDSEEEPQSNVDVHAVQIGNNNTMELNWTGNKMVSASQEGWNNTMDVNLVPPGSKPNVRVSLTKNPRDEKLENLLVKVFNEESEFVNIRVKDLDASKVTFWRGSIVMEIEVKPGVTIDKEYIEKLMNAIFSGKAGKVIPEGTKFDVNIQTKMMIPVDQLGKYVHLNPEKIHENCVSKEKYEEKVKEIQQLQSRLVQGLLKNPKQDQVLQNALKNFISSVLTAFAFAMLTEIPALQVSGSTTQEATAREEEKNPMVSDVDSGYEEITPKKGSRLIEEQSNPAPSSTEITSRHSKWRFDVLIIQDEDTYPWGNLNEFLTRHAFKCETIKSFKLNKDHHLLKSSKYVICYGGRWHSDKELFQWISFHHRRVICLHYDNYLLHRLHYLPPDVVLTFINIRGGFWREDILEQLRRSEHQSPRETTFDDELTEKTHQIFDSVYGFGENRPDFLVKHDGPEVSIQWTEQMQRKAVVQTGRGRQVKKSASLNLKSRKQKIEEAFPKVFSGLYDEVPSFTVQEKGDTITIKWTEENFRRKHYTIGSQEEAKASGMRKTDKRETTGMRRAEQGERTGMRKTVVEGEKDVDGAKKLAQKEEKHTVNLEEVLESYAREGKKYEDFREAVHKSLGSESSWRKIASVLYATKNVMSRHGTTMAAPLRQLAEKFVKEECADFIIQQEGWPMVSGIITTREHEFDVQGISERTGFGSNETTPKKACQELLKDRECRFSSWLRKQSFCNKLNIFMWPQVFVVICDSCIYYYRNETARRPSGSFSLYGYNKIERATDVPHTEAPWAFRIIHTFKEYKTYLFSASSEVEMKEWMKRIKKEMKLANNQDIPGTAVGADDSDDGYHTYQEIETKIYDDPDDLKIPTNYRNRKNDDYSDDDDIYAIREPVAPPVPAQKGGRTRGATMHTPRVKQLTSELNLKLDLSKQEHAVKEPQRHQTDLIDQSTTVQLKKRRGDPDGASIKSEHKEVYTDAASSQVDDDDDDGVEQDPDTYWAAIHYLGHNTAKATEIIQTLAEDGVYLVRDSTSLNGDKVLVVFAEDSPRKFKIEWKDEQLFLNSRKDVCRPSLQELLHFYYENNLPNYKVCLTTPYKLHPKFKESMLK